VDFSYGKKYLQPVLPVNYTKARTAQDDDKLTCIKFFSQTFYESRNDFPATSINNKVGRNYLSVAFF